jgi:hypothetical protein
MLENDFGHAMTVITLILIILYTIGLFDRKKKNEHREQQKKTETPLINETTTETSENVAKDVEEKTGEDVTEDDVEKEAEKNENEQWAAFVASLPEKIASLPDIQAIKAKAGEDVTEDDVERELEIRPDFWRQLAEMVFSNEKTPLAVIARLGIRIHEKWCDKEFLDWFTVYIKRACKNVTPKDWLTLEDKELYFLKYRLDLRKNLSEHTDEISSLKMLRSAHNIIDGNIHNKYYAGKKTSEYESFIREMEAIRGKIVSRIKNESVTLEGALKVWQEEDFQDNSYFLYNLPECNIKNEVRETIDNFIREQIRETKTLAELNAIKTYGFCESFEKYWRNKLLEQDKLRRIREAAQQ